MASQKKLVFADIVIKIENQPYRYKGYMNYSNNISNPSCVMLDDRLTLGEASGYFFIRKPITANIIRQLTQGEIAQGLVLSNVEQIRISKIILSGGSFEYDTNVFYAGNIYIGDFPLNIL